MSRVKNILGEAIELIGTEFPNHNSEQLTELVMIVIGNKVKDFEKLSEEDKFDFLVDSIISYERFKVLEKGNDTDIDICINRKNKVPIDKL